MLDIIEIDLPQLPVQHFRGTSTLKEMPVLLNPEMYLWGYFNRKFEEFAVRHAIINDQLQNIYISHAKERKQRQEEEYYEIDTAHYGELHTISLVVHSLKQLLEELITIFYFVHYAKTFDRLGADTLLDRKIAELKSIADIQPEMQLIESLYTELTRITSGSFFVYDETIRHLVDDEPMILLPTKQDFIFANLEKVPLTPMVDQYKQVFELSKPLFKKIAPDALVLY